MKPAESTPPIAEKTVPKLVYDWLSEETDDVATALRERTTPCGFISHGDFGDSNRTPWTWRCRCGGYQVGLAPGCASVGVASIFVAA